MAPGFPSPDLKEGTSPKHSTSPLEVDLLFYLIAYGIAKNGTWCIFSPAASNTSSSRFPPVLRFHTVIKMFFLSAIWPIRRLDKKTDSLILGFNTSYAPRSLRRGFFYNGQAVVALFAAFSSGFASFSCSVTVRRLSRFFTLDLNSVLFFSVLRLDFRP